MLTAEERAAILAYCESDVTTLEKLPTVMLPRIDLPRAILRGRFMKAAAAIEWNGTPITVEDAATADYRGVDIALFSAGKGTSLELGPHPQVIVARTGALTYANLPARALFGIGLEDFGRPFHDLDLSYQPTELRGAIDESMRERRRVSLGEQRFRIVAEA